MTLAEFLLARIAEDREVAIARDGGLLEGDAHFHWQRMLAECEAKRRIVELHKAWPVLVETPPTFETAVGAPDINSVAFYASQQIMWQTEQEYRKRFGDEPPTAPILAAMAEVYADHPDYDEAWRPHT